MGRKILFVTTDQQRYDTLGCNGGTLARTPVVDGLAAGGVRYERAHPQSVVCMPSRSTMHHRPAPEHARRVDERRAAARRRAVGRAGAARRRLPHRAGRQAALRAVPRPVRPLRREPLRPATATDGGIAPRLRAPRGRHPRRARPAALRPLAGRRAPRGGRRCSTRCSTRALEVNAAGGGDTGAPQVHDNPIPREWYHTDWVADRTIAWLDSLDADDDWFCWMSFPDPHHPWDPPASEVGRIDWRDVPLPAGYIERRGRARGDPRRQAAPLAALVRRHAGVQLRGAARLGAGDADRRPGARGQRPQRGRVRADRRGARPGAGRRRRRAGWADDVDVVFTTDHGELQGDFGLLFKGPYHVDGLMRLPLIWRPAPSAGAAPVDGHAARSASSTWRRRSARSPASPVPDVDGGPAAARRRRRRRRPRLRAGAHRVGQRAVRRRRAPAHDHPRRLGVHRLPARVQSTTAPRASCTTSRRSAAAGQPLGRPGAAPRCATTWSPTCGTTSPPPHRPLRRVEAPV